MKNKLISILIASMILLTACSPKSTSSVGSDALIAPSSQPESAETESSKPISSELVSSEIEAIVSEPVSSEPVSSKLQESIPEWTEEAYNALMYTKEVCSSRVKPLKGADTVRGMEFAEQVNVVAKTNTEYFKTDKGDYIHQYFLIDKKPEQPKPVEKPKDTTVNELGDPLTGTEDNPDPDGDGYINLTVNYDEQNRVPSLGQFDKVGTDLQSGGHYHGEKNEAGDNIWHYGNGNGYWVWHEHFYLGRYGQHPEVPEEWYERHMNDPVSPFQEHGDKNKEGSVWCSYCGTWVVNSIWNETPEKKYAICKGSTDHYNNAKKGIQIPQSYIQAKNYPDSSKTTLGNMWGNTYGSNENIYK